MYTVNVKIFNEEKFCSIYSSYENSKQHIRITFIVTPFAGKVLRTSCKCYHLIRIMNKHVTTSVQNIHRKTFVRVARLKICESFPP